MLRIISFITLFAWPMVVSSHTYHMGSDCAPVKPMLDFDMDKFIGKWYAIEKTSTSSRCLVYNFKETDNRKIYKVLQVSENAVIGLVKDNVYRYEGELEMKNDNMKAEMSVKFPLNVAGRASFIVLGTDYDNYAAVYSCQSIGFTHRVSATILSRKKSLDSITIEKIRNRLTTFNVNPFDMNRINQTDCSLTDDKFTISIDDHTFSKEKMMNTLKKVGSVISTGVSAVVKEAKKAYNSVQENKNSPHKSDENRDREETTYNPKGYHEPYAEFL